MHEGACQDEAEVDFDWHFDPAFPLSKVEVETDLVQWMKDELKMWSEEGQPTRYDDMLHGQTIGEPIVLHVDERGVGRIWDGWHRTGSQALQNVKTIPAVVGIRKPPSTA